MNRSLSITALFAFVGLSSSILGQNANLIWANRMGGIQKDIGNAVAVDASGNVYSTGSFTGTADFDPSTGIYNLLATGSDDIYVTKQSSSGSLIWAKKIGGTNIDLSYSIALDNNGNVYTTGSFRGTVDFDPGPGVFNLTSIGSILSDIFISKIDSSGNFVWAKQLGGTNHEEGHSIIIDLNGNVYSTGYFTAVADFDPGPGTYNLTSGGSLSHYISKLNSAGNFVWAKSMSGPGDAAGLCIAVDANENVYTTGYFEGTSDFDPGPGTFNLTSASVGFWDVFISKLDILGNFVWAKGIGGTSNDRGFSIAVDNNENIFTTGYFGNTVDFDPGLGTYNLSSNEGTTFILKLNASGTFEWAKQLGGTNAAGPSITINDNGDIYSTGEFGSTADFDPGPSTYNLVSAGGLDIFITKIDTYGNFVWANRIGGLEDDFCNSIVVDDNGNVYTCGTFKMTSDFDPGSGIYNLTSTGSNDIFVTKLSDPLISISPQIYLDKAIIQIGQTDSVWGKFFSPNGQIRISISNRDQQTTITDTVIVANGQGYFNFIYHFISTLPQGQFNIQATDQVTLRSTYLVRLIVANNTTIINRELKINTPLTNSTSKTNYPIQLSWKDRPSNLNNLIQNTSRLIVSYRIEYNKDNSGWQLITIKYDQAEYQQIKGFQHSFTPIQSGNYQFRVTDAYDSQNLDNSSIITVLDDGSGAEINYDWDYSGNRPVDKKPIGVVADGTARIYLKVSKKMFNTRTISNVNISVLDPNNNSIIESRLLGKLLKATDTSNYSIEANSAISTSESSTNSGSGNTFWFWYVAPDDFVRNNNDTLESERILQLSAIVNYTDNSSEQITNNIKVVRPPLMLVHGWGGAESSWDEFYFKNSTNAEYYKNSALWKNSNQRAVTMNPIGGFAENARYLLNLLPNGNYKRVNNLIYPSNSFQYFLMQMRDIGYATNRLDYVCHSMGGAMGRTAMNLYSSKYNPAVSDTTLYKNYGKGFINKFITLNTPHNGSPWADFIINNSTANSNLGHLLQTLFVYSNSDYVRDLILSMFPTIPNSYLLDFSQPTQAFQNLRHGIDGVKFLRSNVKNHLLAGDIIDNAGVCNSTLNALSNIEGFGLFRKVLRLYNLRTCQQVDNIFNQYGLTNFFLNGDVVVDLNSQLPGKNINSSGTDYSIFYGLNSFHLTVRNSSNNLPISLKTFQLLNSPISSNFFSDTIAANPSVGPIVYRNDAQNANLNSSQYFDTSRIVIDSPNEMDYILVDSTMTINLRLKDTANHKYTSILFQGEIYTTTAKIKNQTFVVQVNPLYPDIQIIYATAVYDSLGNDIYYNDTLSLNVVKDTSVQGFIVNPTTKVLLSDQKYVPEYLLIHNNYVSNLSIADTAIHFIIADTAVVSFSNEGKFFQAKDTGSTYVIFNYRNFKDTLFFIISTIDVCRLMASVTINGNTTFCSGDSVQLVANSNMSNYIWSNGDTTRIIYASSAGNYSVQVTDSTGCRAISQQVTVTVNPAPSVANAGPDQTVCTTTTTLAGNIPAIGTGFWAVVSGTATITNPTSSNSEVTGLGAGANILRWTISSISCTPSFDDVTITVNQVPIQPAIINGSNNICRDSTEIYSIAPVAGATGYSWVLPTGWSGSSTSNTIQATANNGSGTISVRAINFCGSSPDQILAVTVNQIPSQPGNISGIVSAITGQTLTYSISSINGATGYNWTLSGGGNITTGQNTTEISINWLSQGNYILSVSAVNTCGTSTTRTLNISVSFPTGVINPDNTFQIKVIPNPSQGEFYLTAKGVINMDIDIEISSLLGQKIYSKRLKAGTNDFTYLINLRNLADGIYTVKIAIGKKLYLRTITKQE